MSWNERLHDLGVSIATEYVTDLALVADDRRPDDVKRAALEAVEARVQARLKRLQGAARRAGDAHARPYQPPAVLERYRLEPRYVARAAGVLVYDRLLSVPVGGLLAAGEAAMPTVGVTVGFTLRLKGGPPRAFEPCDLRGALRDECAVFWRRVT